MTKMDVAFFPDSVHFEFYIRGVINTKILIYSTHGDK